MELIESTFKMLMCGEPCKQHHTTPPLWTGKSINPKCIMHTLVRIMKNPISEDQIPRQLCLLNDLKLGLNCGFWVQDIENSTKLIEILMCKSEVVPVFFEYVTYLLDLMKYPPLMVRTNEILEYERDVQSYFDFFGYILVTTSRLCVRQTIISSIKTLLEYKPILKDYSMPLQMMTAQIEKSNLPLILAQYMELCTDDVYSDLVQVITGFSRFSETMCLNLIKDGCLQVLMTRLDPQWQEHINGPRPVYDHVEMRTVSINNYLDDSLMLIYTLLNTYRNNSDNAIKDEVITPTVEALWGLRFVLHLYTIQESYKNERNFTAALCLLFIECFPDAKHVHSGLVHDYALLSTIGDATLGGKWASTVRFNVAGDDDYEFKKSMMMGLILCKDCLGATRICKDEGVIPAISKLLDCETTSWSLKYQEPLMVSALYVFQHLFSSHADEFMISSGSESIIKILQELATLGNYEQRYVVYFQTVRFCFMVICSIRGDPYFSNMCLLHQHTLQRNIIRKLFDMDLKLKNQKLITQCLNILGVLPPYECACDVEFLIALLKRVLNPRKGDNGYIQRIFVSAIWLVWKHGLHNTVNFLYFIKLKGIYLILDLMKDADYTVQLICLGFLVDVIEEGTAIPYLVTWQKDGVGILALLMDIFRKECNARGVAMLDRGVIADPKFPLMGKIQKDAIMEKDSLMHGSPAISDLFLSCRPKVFAIIALLNNQHSGTLELVNNYYKMYDTNLSIEDKITKVLVEHFLKIKYGEMWLELAIYLYPIEPVPSHEYLLKTLEHHYVNCGLHIQKLQNNWLIIERKNDHLAEEDYYNLLRETKLGPAILGLQEMKYLARAGNTHFRKSYYSEMADNSGKGIIETHRTMHGVNAFVKVAGQKLTIQSDIIIDPFAPIPPRSVSKDGDSCMSMYDSMHSDVSLPLPIDCKEYTSNEDDKYCLGPQLELDIPIPKRPKHCSSGESLNQTNREDAK